MNQQPKLFCCSWIEAIGEDIRMLGGRKEIAPRLFTDCDEETAQDRLKACLSPGHSMEFKPAQVLKIKKWALEQFGRSYTVEFEDEQLGLRHEVIDPEEERDALKREFIEAVRTQQRLLERIERAEQRASTTGRTRR